MNIGRRDEVPKDKREYSETYELGYRLDYLLGIILVFVGFLYVIYKVEIEDLLNGIGGIF